jgi:hypothetical protein
MKKSFCRKVIASIFLFANLLTAHAADMSKEERAARMAYAKLIFAAELGALHHEVGANIMARAKHQEQVDASQIISRLESARLRFELTNFKVGKIADIAAMNYSQPVKFAALPKP